MYDSAIDTALSMRLDILVFDEPTRGLDPRARRSLIEFLEEMGPTVFVSTNDIPFVEKIFPRMMNILGGKY